MKETSESEHSNEHNWFIRWKHTWSGRLAWLVLDLAIAYVFASLAVDSGALWQWGIAVFFFIDGTYNLVRFIGKLSNGRKANKA